MFAFMVGAGTPIDVIQPVMAAGEELSALLYLALPHRSFSLLPSGQTPCRQTPETLSSFGWLWCTVFFRYHQLPVL